VTICTGWAIARLGANPTTTVNHDCDHSGLPTAIPISRALAMLVLASNGFDKLTAP
jgi:hypothetical protein